MHFSYILISCESLPGVDFVGCKYIEVDGIRYIYVISPICCETVFVWACELKQTSARLKLNVISRYSGVRVS